jgi:protoporphyrinogen/coproporphyrinogen III oxidase
MNSEHPRVAILGGGISGLAAAYEVTRRRPNAKITLFEGSERLGGAIFSESREGWLLDHAADNFIVQPDAALKLCQDLGIADQLIEPNAEDRRALVLFRGKPTAIPEGLALMRPTRLRAVLLSPLLSWKAKLRLLMEPLRPKRDGSTDESLAEFVRRRLGDEFLSRIVQPLIAGIYTGDAETLSVQATVPQVVEMEQKYGSLLRGTLAQRRSNQDAAERKASGARYGQFRAFPGGTYELIKALHQAIAGQADIRLNCRAIAIARDFENRWQVRSKAGDEQFDAVISALPAPRLVSLVQGFSKELSTLLSGIPYASSAIVLLGIRASDLATPLQGFGLVVPEIEGRKSIAISYADRKYPGRTPQGRHLLRIFFGGAMHPEMMKLTDDELVALGKTEAKDLLGLRGEPELTGVVRWVEKMPQYLVGHLERVKKIREQAKFLPGLVLVGNAYDGVGIPQCVASARREAAALCRTL